MCIVPPPYVDSLTIHGSCSLVPNAAGWNAAAASGGVPVQGGTSVLRARSAADQPWKAVFFTSSNQLNERWFTQDGQTMAFRFCWDQTAVSSQNWCRLLAQVTALAGQPPIAPPHGPRLQGHPTHPAGNWEFSIRWWAADNLPTQPRAKARTDAFRLANVHQVAVRQLIRSTPPIDPAFLSQRLAAIGPCGCL